MEKKLEHEEILKLDFENAYTGKEITYKNMLNPGLCEGEAGRRKTSLNGVWNFGVDLYNTALRKRFFEEEYEDKDGNELPLDYSFDDWDKVKVPFCFNTFRDEFFWYEGNAIFTRKFRHDPVGNRRVFLKIGAANYESKVFLNKRFIGRHVGGYTPFYIEVTEHLQKENRIIIMADNERRMDGIPSVNTDWFNYGGLQRDVELHYTPVNYIKDFFVYLKNDDKYDKIVCDVEVIGGNGSAVIEIPELNVRQEITLADGRGSAEIIARPVLWDTENPKLYDVVIQYGEDSVTDRIGFRQISVRGTQVLLNGKELFFRGICAHEESAKNGRALTDAERLRNISLAKELGCNAMRLAHYPHHENMARFADEHGLLLWEEIPVYWALQFSNPATYENARNQLLELMNRDRNRASVIIWSVGNENPDSDERLAFMKNLSCEAKRHDPTRLTAAACLVTAGIVKIEDRLAEFIDIVGVNEYYGWYDRDFGKLEKMLSNSASLNKPLFITETGGDALDGHHGNELFTEEYQERLYRNQIDVISRHDVVKGLFPWILYDFRTPVRMSKFQKCYNRKGLLNADKTYKKLAFYILQGFYKR